MKTMGATEFKAHCLAVLDEVAATGEPVVVTKRGKPVARVTPAGGSTARYPQDALRGTVHILGDILSPAIPAGDWEAEGGRSE